jgi:hypothetical protein
VTSRRPAPFEARYGGPCAAACGAHIHPGDPVRYVDGELCHADCASDDSTAPRQPAVCPACWTVHAGECL